MGPPYTWRIEPFFWGTATVRILKHLTPVLGSLQGWNLGYFPDNSRLDVDMHRHIYIYNIIYLTILMYMFHSSIQVTNVYNKQIIQHTVYWMFHNMPECRNIVPQSCENELTNWCFPHKEDLWLFSPSNVFAFVCWFLLGSLTCGPAPECPAAMAVTSLQNCHLHRGEMMWNGHWSWSNEMSGRVPFPGRDFWGSMYMNSKETTRLWCVSSWRSSLLSVCIYMHAYIMIYEIIWMR